MAGPHSREVGLWSGGELGLVGLVGHLREPRGISSVCWPGSVSLSGVWGPGVVHPGLTQTKEGYLRLESTGLGHWAKLSSVRAWPEKGDPEGHLDMRCLDLAEYLASCPGVLAVLFGLCYPRAISRSPDSERIIPSFAPGFS